MLTKLTITGLFIVALISSQCSKVVWHEGENYTESDKGVGIIVGERPPASGGRALDGTGIGGSGIGAFSIKGRNVRYVFDIKQNIPDAKIIFRYARLHWRNTMKPSEITCEVKNAEKIYNLDLLFGDTKGWGTNGPSEWGLLEAGIGDLNKGQVEINMTANSEMGDISLDGFFIAPQEFKMIPEEIKDLSRIKIDDSGYIGINLPFSAIEQNEFMGFEIIIRAFKRKYWKLSAFLMDEKGAQIASLLNETKISPDDSMRLNIKPDEIKNLDDGNYTLVIPFNKNQDSLTFPFTVLGNIIMQAEKMKTEYQSFIAENEKKSDPAWKTVIDDIKYATDYIENTIFYLRSKSGYATESERKKALAYFEKARNRSAQTFSDDLRKIIRQSNETIQRMKNNEDPYAGRSGDFRRAFYSASTGKLEPYRIYVPSSYEKNDKLQVMLVLHGGGGDENYYPDMDNGAIMEIMEREGVIMVSPRATSWYIDDGAKDMVQLVKLVLQEYPKADKSRVYSTGVSAGGFGTYNLAVEYPGLFAAVACVSGSSRNNLDKISNLKNTPCLIIHGGSDPVVSIENANITSARLKELGYPHELNIFPTYGHDYHAEEYMNLTLDFIRRYGK